MEKIDIKSLNYDELADYIVSIGEKSSGRHSYIHGCMKNLPGVMMR